MMNEALRMLTEPNDACRILEIVGILRRVRQYPTSRKPSVYYVPCKPWYACLSSHGCLEVKIRQPPRIRQRYGPEGVVCLVYPYMDVLFWNLRKHALMSVVSQTCFVYTTRLIEQV